MITASFYKFEDKILTNIPSTADASVLASADGFSLRCTEGESIAEAEEVAGSIRVALMFEGLVTVKRDKNGDRFVGCTRVLQVSAIDVLNKLKAHLGAKAVKWVNLPPSEKK
jgi:hypothetical protein